MKKIITTDITNSVGMPIKSGTLDHLQSAYQEALDSIVRQLTGAYDSSKVYVLNGCENSGTGGDYNISAGAVFYNGEIFIVPSASFTPSGTAVANIDTSYFTSSIADPVEFTDGTPRSVHEIRQIVITDATSGSGVSDYDDFIQLGVKNETISVLSANYTITFEQDRTTFFNSAPNSSTFTFDFTNAVKGCVVRLKWLFGASKTLTITAPSGCTVVKDSGTLANVASNVNVIYFLYTGINNIGNHEVSYSIKQV
jgi:hypothetical protein